MKIGFTGTQKGLTEIQKSRLENTILFLLYSEISDKENEFHHGDCVGADAEFHQLCIKLRESEEIPLTLIIHPPINPLRRANCENGTVLPEKEYIDRNHDIVDSSMLMIACPFGNLEERYSGTWATIRYSKKKNKPLVIIYPDGLCSTFNLDKR